MKTINYFLTLCLFITTSVHAHSLSPVEIAIKDDIAKQQPQALSLLEQLVNINSGTTNINGVHQVGNILSQQFKQLGFETHWAEMPANLHRAGTLIAEHKGSKGKKLLLIGHLDTVFQADSPFQHFERHGDIVTGPGVIDMKGGDVAIIYALKALRSAGALDDASITVVLTGDEEDSGKPVAISRQALFNAAKGKEVALDFEWSIGLNTATIARRGISLWVLTTHGAGGHSSEIFQPSVGAGAIYEVARILDGFRTQLAAEKNLTISPGVLLGGRAVDFDNIMSKGAVSGEKNVIAENAFAKGDLRFLSEEQKTSAEKKMLSIVNQHLPMTQATLTFTDVIPAMQPTLGNKNLLQQYSDVSTDLGYGKVSPVDPGLRGAADISHIAGMVPENLAGLGLEGTGAHSDKETLHVKSFTMNTQRAALLIYRLIH